MTLPEVIDQVLPAVVALGSRVVPSPNRQAPIFPLIFGTGFLIDPRGVVVTNNHVAQLLAQLPAEARLTVLYVPAQQRKEGLAAGLLFRRILKFAVLGEFRPAQQYYGEDRPDIAFLQIDVKDVPYLKINREPNVIQIGKEVAVAGFPLGDLPLRIHGKISQLTATVRRGIISAIYPAPSPFPDGFTTDIAIQGGNSGSPVFLTQNGLVIGMIHAHAVGAENLALAVPSNMIATGFESSLDKGDLETEGLPTWNSLLDEEGQSDLGWEVLSFPSPDK